MARLYPLFSGSSGNCYYFCSGGSGIIIDAGRSARQILGALHDNDINEKSVKAIFITHEHGDHISGLNTLASRLKVPVYATEGTFEYLRQRGKLERRNKYIILDKDSVTAGEMTVKKFATSHDSAESCGFVINLPDGRSLAVATDLGYLSEEVITALTGCTAIVIESNHDERMLKNGPYPYYLKRRILSNVGHLSNDACGTVLPKLVKKGTTRIVLAHLSAENNMPEIAEQSALLALSEHGMKTDIDFCLSVAPVVTGGEVIVF